MKRFIVMLFILLMLPATVFAHSGDTDSNGGHYDGSDYHYHHGYPAHDHEDTDGNGTVDCPYDFDDQTGWNSGSNTIKSKSTTTTSSVKKTSQKETPKPIWPIILKVFFAAVCLAIIVILAHISRKKSNVIDSLNSKYKSKEDENSSNLIALHELLVKKYGKTYLEKALNIPEGTIMQQNGLPSSDTKSTKAPWGEKYTVYLGSRARISEKYHKLDCRYSCGDMPVNIVSAKEHRLKPCGVCHPEDPDLSWVYKYRKIKKFLSDYDVEI